MRTVTPRSEVAGTVMTPTVTNVHPGIITQVAKEVAVPYHQVSIFFTNQRVGNYNPYWGQTGYWGCPSGEYAGAGEDYCHTIPGGFQWVNANSQGIPCPPGFYESGRRCYVCTAGYYCRGLTVGQNGAVSQPYYATTGSKWKTITEAGH